MINTLSIILNGPPGSGKDTIGQFLVNHFWEKIRTNDNPMIPQYNGAETKQFKQKLLELTMLIYGIDRERFFAIYNNRELKETPLPEFDGLSARQAMIKVSEEVIKPNYGKDYFGKCAAKELRHGGINVFTDGGFVEEMIPVSVVSDIVLVHLEREGYTYANDSRRKVELSEAIHTITFNNCYDNLDDLFNIGCNQIADIALNAVKVKNTLMLQRN